MNTQEAYQLITRTLSHEASPEEQKILTGWRKENPENEKLFRDAEYIWNGAHPENEGDIDTDAAWQKVRSRIQVSPVKRSSSFLKIAASLVAGGLGLAAYLFVPSSVNVQTAAAEMKEISLPDGSHVWLNEGSSITYNRSFRGKERKVELEGEAFFEVEKDPTKPFVITTPDAETRVLGTSFNLSAYRADSGTVLTVSTGKVSFTSTVSQQSIILVAGEKASAKISGSVEKADAATENDLAWKTRKLRFNDALLSDVFPALEKYYHIRINVENSAILDCHFTGEYPEPDLRTILDDLSRTLQLSYEKKNTKIRISGKGCRS